MIFNRDLEARIKALEERLDRRDRKDECVAGRHEWVMNEEWGYPTRSGKFYIECKFCAERYREKDKVLPEMLSVEIPEPSDVRKGRKK